MYLSGIYKREKKPHKIYHCGSKEQSPTACGRVSFNLLHLYAIFYHCFKRKFGKLKAQRYYLIINDSIN